MSQTPKAGQVVRNLGTLAVVVGTHESSGSLILRPIYADGTFWLANPLLCEAVGESEPMSHTSGLVVFD